MTMTATAVTTAAAPAGAATTATATDSNPMAGIIYPPPEVRGNFIYSFNRIPN